LPSQPACLHQTLPCDRKFDHPRREFIAGCLECPLLHARINRQKHTARRDAGQAVSIIHNSPPIESRERSEVSRVMNWSESSPQPGRYPPDGRTLEQAMAAIRHAPVEIGYGYDADGQLRFVQVGDDNGIVGFDQNDLAAIAGGLFVHNHPPYDFPEGDPRRRAGSFSPHDLVFMWEYDLVEMVAVTAERTYVLRRPPGGYFLDPGEIIQEYDKLVDAVRIRLNHAADSGLIDPQEALARGRWADDVMEILALYYDYFWTEVPK
jgi:hypothetical protein